jgi:hypothetical protein
MRAPAARTPLTGTRPIAPMASTALSGRMSLMNSKEITMSDVNHEPMSPGDEAPEGTPGTGENICPECGGKGVVASGQPCPNCEGTGKVIEGIGGA